MTGGAGIPAPVAMMQAANPLEGTLSGKVLVCLYETEDETSPAEIGLLAFLSAASVAFLFSFAAPKANKMREANNRTIEYIWYLVGLLPITVVTFWWMAMAHPSVSIRLLVLGALGAVVGAVVFVLLGELVAPSSAQNALQSEAAKPSDEAQTSPATPALPPGASGNFNFNQQGGTSNQTYINQVPPPDVFLARESDWIPTPQGLRKDIELKVQSPAEINRLILTIHGENLLKASFLYTKSAGMIIAGRSQSGQGWVSAETNTPSAVRGISVTAIKPTEIIVEKRIE
ncbi:MAG: hypothetical protein AB7H90_20265 [Alphaproteobacteria bacterium]